MKKINILSIVRIVFSSLFVGVGFYAISLGGYGILMYLEEQFGIIIDYYLITLIFYVLLGLFLLYLASKIDLGGEKEIDFLVEELDKLEKQNSILTRKLGRCQQ